MRPKLLITLLAAVISLAMSGEEFYDFKVNGIAYKINEDAPTTVSVAKEQDPNIAETNYTSYANLTGTLTLPERVTHDGVTYTVTAIGLEAFQGCAGLTGELVLPKTITLIDHWAFYQCSGLTGHVVIPDGVTMVGYGAFGECDGLRSVTVPASVQQLDPGSLDAPGLDTVVVLMDDITSIAARFKRGIFHYTSTGVDLSTCRLVVPAVAQQQYQVFIPWCDFEHVDLLENVDGQGTVDVSDVNMTINAMLGKISDPQVVTAADVNRDGAADVSDVNRIINAMLGKHPRLWDSSVTIDMSGSYDTDMEQSTYNGVTFAEWAAQYGKTTQCTGINIERIAPGIFFCNDIFGGCYSQILDAGFMYLMSCYLRVDNEGNVSLMSSYCPAWESGLGALTDGHYDSATATLSCNLMFNGRPFHIVLRLP